MRCGRSGCPPSGRSYPPHREAGDRNSWLWRVGRASQLRAEKLTPWAGPRTQLRRRQRFPHTSSARRRASILAVGFRVETFLKGLTEDASGRHYLPSAAQKEPGERLPRRPFISLPTKWRPRHPEINPLIGSPRPAPQRFCRASRPYPAHLRRSRRAGRKARSHRCWKGGAELRAVRKPAKRSFRLGPLVPEEEEVLPSGLRLLFRASIRVPRGFSARTSAPPVRGGYSFPCLALCVLSCLRPSYVTFRSPRAIPHFFVRFRFQSPFVIPRGLGPCHLKGARELL